MNRSDIVREISKELGLPQYKVDRVVKSFVDRLSDHISSGETVRLCNFGRFEPRLKRAYIRYDPLHDKVVSIPERVSVSFVPANNLRNRMNE